MLLKKVRFQQNEKKSKILYTSHKSTRCKDEIKFCIFLEQTHNIW